MNIFDLLKDNYLELENDFINDNITLSYLQPYNTYVKSSLFIDKVKPEEYKDYLTDYEIKNEAWADGLSDLLYGTTEYWWIILYLNGYENPYLFNMNPKTANSLIEALNIKYKDFINNKTFWQDLVYDYIQRKRKIKIIKPEYLNNFLNIMKDRNK